MHIKWFSKIISQALIELFEHYGKASRISLMSLFVVRAVRGHSYCAVKGCENQKVIQCTSKGCKMLWTIFVYQTKGRSTQSKNYIRLISNSNYHLAAECNVSCPEAEAGCGSEFLHLIHRTAYYRVYCIVLG